jgi:hypothetical protein
VELTVVMPCLNEAETVATCVRKAVTYLREHDIDGEVVVADNGSTDGSQQLATDAGARVVPVSEKGYGNALMGGIVAARGEFVIMGDADDSYDFTNLMPFIEELRQGADLVMGNRFRGGIEPGAMPPLHRYLGNPVLSFLGRWFFRAKVGDFHCGLRGFDRDAIMALGLSSPGMEFASEMVVKAMLHRLDVREVPTTLAPDGRSRPPHLRTWRDGWRHLRFLLTHAPRMLFLYPGLAAMALGTAGVALLSTGGVDVAGVEFSATTMLFAAMLVLLGSQLVGFGVLARLYGVSSGVWPGGRSVDRFRRLFSVERGCILGGALFALGLAGSAGLFAAWMRAGFGEMEPLTMMRLAIPAVLATVIGLQTMFTSFLIGLVDGGER